jgi:hypothetical protein
MHVPHGSQCRLRRTQANDPFLLVSGLHPPGAAVVTGRSRRGLDEHHLYLRANRAPDHVAASFRVHRDSWRRVAGGPLGHGSVATREPQVGPANPSVLVCRTGQWGSSERHADSMAGQGPGLASSVDTGAAGRASAWPAPPGRRSCGLVRRVRIAMTGQLRLLDDRPDHRRTIGNQHATWFGCCSRDGTSSGLRQCHARATAPAGAYLSPTCHARIFPIAVRRRVLRARVAVRRSPANGRRIPVPKLLGPVLIRRRDG